MIRARRSAAPRHTLLGVRWSAQLLLLMLTAVLLAALVAAALVQLAGGR